MTLVGRKARNHPQQIARLGVDDTIDDRRTPPQLFREQHHVHGFTLDAAASDENHLLSTYYTRARSGLDHSWAGERVWCNPPYSNIGVWVEKAWRAIEHEHAICIVMLLPNNRCEQPWWQRLIEPYRDGKAEMFRFELRTVFVNARWKFGRPKGSERKSHDDRPPFGLVLVKWLRR